MSNYILYFLVPVTCTFTIDNWVHNVFIDGIDKTSDVSGNLENCEEAAAAAKAAFTPTRLFCRFRVKAAACGRRGESAWVSRRA